MAPHRNSPDTRVSIAASPNPAPGPSQQRDPSPHSHSKHRPPEQQHQHERVHINEHSDDAGPSRCPPTHADVVSSKRKREREPCQSSPPAARSLLFKWRLPEMATGLRYGKSHPEPPRTNEQQDQQDASTSVLTRPGEAANSVPPADTSHDRTVSKTVSPYYRASASVPDRKSVV